MGIMHPKGLQQILEEGEGQFIEFKEDLDKSLSKEIVAFANASGGQIFLGINDKNRVKGIRITNKIKSQIIDIGKNCDPRIFLKLEELNSILIVNVSESENKPHQCSSGFYLRLGSNSQKLSRDEILEFCIKENKIRFDEQICTGFDFKDFDDDKFNEYIMLANISNNLNTKDMLWNLKVLTEKGMTNAGVLFFAKEPYKYISSSKIRCVLFRGNDRINILDKKEVDKGIIGNIEFAVNYLRDHVPVRFKIKGIRRFEYPQFPEEAYREAIVNAIIHRDYFENGEVAVEKLKSAIYINNPGGLLPSFPKEDFGKLSWPRNRLLADLISKTYLMEKVGTGIKRIKSLCAKNNNAVDLRYRKTHFFVEMKSPSSDEERLGENQIKNYPKSSEKTSEEIMNIMKKDSNISAKEIAKILGKTPRAIEMQIARLKEIGRIKRIGPDKGGHWEVIGKLS
ncbi:MAG: putative DNA binding domain-containing protein [Nanoarchaeota archaeon]|nr:putative DNA binding domain-containing protein [Nanoarchaeota archaeon]